MPPPTVFCLPLAPAPRAHRRPRRGRHLVSLLEIGEWEVLSEHRETGTNLERLDGGVLVESHESPGDDAPSLAVGVQQVVSHIVNMRIGEDSGVEIAEDWAGDVGDGGADGVAGACGSGRWWHHLSGGGGGVAAACGWGRWWHHPSSGGGSVVVGGGGAEASSIVLSVEGVDVRSTTARIRRH